MSYATAVSLVMCQTLKFTRKELPPCMQDGCWPFPLSYQKGIKEIRGVGGCRFGPRSSCLFGDGTAQANARQRDCLPAGQGLGPSGNRVDLLLVLGPLWGVDLETKLSFFFFFSQHHHLLPRPYRGPSPAQ